MIRAVLDTNILISSIFWRGNEYLIIKKALEQKFKILLSESILQELENKLTNKFKFPEDKLQIFKMIMITESESISTKTRFDISRDKDDNHILSCAYDGKADYIVTGDKDLLVLGDVGGIKIVDSHEFLKILSKRY